MECNVFLGFGLIDFIEINYKMKYFKKWGSSICVSVVFVCVGSCVEFGVREFYFSWWF